MILNRSHAITAAVAAASALAATGITYTSAAVASSLAAPTVRQMPAPLQFPVGGDTHNGGTSKGEEDDGGDYDHEGSRHHHVEEGWIHINERSYSAHPGGCITVVSGLGSTSLNVDNDSRRTVEVFRGVTCDNGAPVATVGPGSSANGIKPGPTRAVVVKDGVVGSFRVVDDRDYYGDAEYGDYEV